MRSLIVSLALLSVVMAGCSEPEQNQAPPVWLEVHADGFVLEGNQYKSRDELVVALRAAKDASRIAIHWVVHASNSREEEAVMVKVAEARQAVTEAGLLRREGVGNKVFDR